MTPNSPTLQVYSIHTADSTRIFQIFPASKNGDVSSFFYKIQYKKIQKSKTSSDIKLRNRQTDRETCVFSEHESDVGNKSVAATDDEWNVIVTQNDCKT